MIRAASCFAVVGALAACTGQTIDAGTNEAGSDRGLMTDGGTAPSGPTSIASSIVWAPTRLVSDGTSLFWISDLDPSGGPISRVAAAGGAIDTFLPGPVAVGFDFLAVDDASVYYADSAGIHRAPKSGGAGPATLLGETIGSGGKVVAVTVVGGSLYWVEPSVLKAIPLTGGSVSTVTALEDPGAYQAIGLTTATAFFSGGFRAGIDSFALGAGAPSGGASVPGITDACPSLVSDTDAVYCPSILCGPCFAGADDETAKLLRIASDGTTTVLGSFLGAANSSSGIGANGARIAIDDTAIYWADSLPVGTIMRVPKTGGAASVIARDRFPLAIAVDAHAVYWSDQGGNIFRLAK